MNFNEYQKEAKKYDLFEQTDKLSDAGFIEKILGLVGEAGEFADKIKKILRDKNGIVSNEDRESIEKELGDVLWYVAATARYLGVELEDIAKKNLEKLDSRMKRDRLHGEGDER